MEKKDNKKGNSGLVVVIVVLVLICACMGTYIFMNREKLTAVSGSNNAAVNSSNEQTGTESGNTGGENVNSNQVFSIVSDEEWNRVCPTCGVVSGDSLVEFKVKHDNKKNVAVRVYSGTYEAYGLRAGSLDYTISFEQDVVDIVVGSNGQDMSSNTAYFLMKDGSVYSLNVGCALKANNFQIATKIAENIVNFYSVFSTNSIGTGANKFLGVTSDGKLQPLSLVDFNC